MVITMTVCFDIFVSFGSRAGLTRECAGVEWVHLAQDRGPVAGCCDNPEMDS
jgi:hypothetical protein